jgi:hypothetical protein
MGRLYGDEKKSCSLREYRRHALKAAHELCYGDEVKAKLKDAKSEDEISRIMKTARNARD